MPKRPLPVREVEAAHSAAFRVVQAVIARSEGETPRLAPVIPMPAKNPAAAALGALGGKARASKLSKAERSRIARMGGLAGGRGRKS